MLECSNFLDQHTSNLPNHNHRRFYGLPRTRGEEKKTFLSSAYKRKRVILKPFRSSARICRLCTRRHLGPVYFGKQKNGKLNVEDHCRACQGLGGVAHFSHPMSKGSQCCFMVQHLGLKVDRGVSVTSKASAGQKKTCSPSVYRVSWSRSDTWLQTSTREIVVVLERERGREERDREREERDKRERKRTETLLFFSLSPSLPLLSLSLSLEPPTVFSKLILQPCGQPFLFPVC